MILGKTTKQEIATLLPQLEGVILNASDKIADSAVMPYINTAFAKDDILQLIDVSYRGPALTAADIVMSKGPPCSVYQTSDNTQSEITILAYTDSVIWVGTRDWNLEFSSHITEITLLNPDSWEKYPNEGYADPCWVPNDPKKHSWKGFRHNPDP
jgi:hypothetical protein